MDEYIRESKIIPLTEEEKQKELIISILKTKKKLDVATKNFEFADGDLIDYYAYQIKANRAKIDYLIKIAKDSNLELSMFEQIAMKYKNVI